MSLRTATEARVPSQTLVSLTNMGSTGATTVDTTKLDLACDDVEADFVTYSGETWAESIRRHVVLGVEGVLARLRSWAPDNMGPTAEDLTAWRERVKEYARTAARDRISPETNSPVGTYVNGALVKAPFDHADFSGYQPEFQPESEE